MLFINKLFFILKYLKFLFKCQISLGTPTHFELLVNISVTWLVPFKPPTLISIYKNIVFPMFSFIQAAVSPWKFVAIRFKQIYICVNNCHQDCFPNYLLTTTFLQKAKNNLTTILLDLPTNCPHVPT